MGRKEESRILISAFKDWVKDTPLRIWGWIILTLALIGGLIYVSKWLTNYLIPWNVWLASAFVILGIIGLSFIPFYKRNKSKSVKITVLSAYQPNKPPTIKDRINIDVEFNLKTSALPIKISKIQLLVGAKFLEINSPVLPIDQVSELESYVASFDLEYYQYLDDVINGRSDTYRVCVLAIGHKWISNKFGLGNSLTLLKHNKPDGFNLEIK